MLQFFTKNEKNARLELDTACKDALYPKFEENPSKGQNKTISMFLHDTACPFHSATDYRIKNLVQFHGI